MLNAVRSGGLRTFAENIESVRQSFSPFPMKPIRTAARELELPPTTVHKVQQKRLRLHAYEMKMLQRLQPNDKPKRKEFADNMLQKIFEDEESSDDTLGRPLLALLAASNIDPVSINFLCQRGIEEPRGWIVSILSPVRLLNLNVRFCFNEPGYTLCLFLRSNHKIRVCLTHS